MSVRITETLVWKEDLKLRKAYRIAGETTEFSENAFVLIRDDHGHIGLGSASPLSRVCGETMEMTFAALQTVPGMFDTTEAVEWDLLFSQAELLHRTPAARAAVDIALWDLQCQREGIPVVSKLGKKHVALPTSVTIGIMEEDEARERLNGFLSQGFKAIKLKIGDNVDRDIAMVRLIREWGGPHFALRVDANQGYTLEDLKHFFIATRSANIEMIEQPLRAPAAKTLLNADAEIRDSCMADEDLITIEDATELTTSAAYGLWNVKLMKSGGITPCRRIAELATDSGHPVMWGCSDESRVSITAALHLAMSSASTRWLDLDGSFDLSRDIVTGGFVLEEGMMRLTDKPGLGITPDPLL